jgi:hypothetical protein
MGMVIKTAAYALGSRVGALLLGGTVLWQVAVHAGASHGWAIVHVSSVHVDVTVDHAAYRVEDLKQSPIVCELGPGHHTVRMSRRGKVLFEEAFTVVAGEETILAAWEPIVDDPKTLPSRPTDPRER